MELQTRGNNGQGKEIMRRIIEEQFHQFGHATETSLPMALHLLPLTGVRSAVIYVVSTVFPCHFQKNRIFWIFPSLVNIHAHTHTKHMLITSDHKFNLSQLSTWHHFLSCGAYPSVNKMGIHYHSNRECDFDQLQWLFVGTHVYRYQNPKWRLIIFL